MVELNKIKVGDRLIWKGSAIVSSYGKREVPAIVMRINDSSRIQIKIQTPSGEIIKHVSVNSLDYCEEK